jgi:serine protease Do
MGVRSKHYFYFWKIFLPMISLWLTFCCPQTGTSATAGLELFEQAFIAIAKKVGPAVVNISSERVEARSHRGWFFEDPFFRDFLEPSLEYQKVQSLGSGFFFDADGTIFTNEHVVHGAQKITVILSDKKKFEATVVGVDKKKDIAVLKIKTKNSSPEIFPNALLGDSDQVRVGQWAIAIGNPFVGLERTMTVGVISATGRKLAAMGGHRSTTDFIQTDASINPGNSGGPLCNIKGEVIGINSAIYSTSGGSIGIGFAIPINTAKIILEQIMTGKGKRSESGLSTVLEFRGMVLVALTRDLATQYGYSAVSSGMIVSQVEPDGMAEQAGIQTGDIVLEINRVPVRKFDQARKILDTWSHSRETLLLIQRAENAYYVLLPGEL